jgi:hypothetical protein
MENIIISCYEYCLGQARRDVAANFEDPLIMTAMDIVTAEERIKELRADRWQYLTVCLTKGGEPRLQIISESGLKDSIDNEIAEFAKIANIRSLFIRLDPIFEEACKNLQGFIKPTLRELQRYQNNCNNEIFMINSRMKDDFALMVSSTRARRQNLDEVLNDEKWQSIERVNKAQIEQLKKNAELAEGYIVRVKQIIK